MKTPTQHNFFDPPPPAVLLPATPGPITPPLPAPSVLVAGSAAHEAERDRRSYTSLEFYIGGGR